MQIGIKQISQTELINMLTIRATDGCFFVSLTACTEPTMRKTNNPYAGNVYKIAKINGALNWIYQNSVNNQRVREDSEADFVAKPRSWGMRVKGTPFVLHTPKGTTDPKLYVELKVEKVLSTEYVLKDGTPIDYKELEPFMPERKESNQGLEKEVIICDYRVENIISIKVDGIVYSVVEHQELNKKVG